MASHFLRSPQILLLHIEPGLRIGHMLSARAKALRALYLRVREDYFKTSGIVLRNRIYPECVPVS
jgi:hypothetical protein